MTQAKATEFTQAMIVEHLSRHHPHCPDDVKAKVVAVLAQRKWKTPIALGKAVGVVMTAHVRHELTAYEEVIGLHGITREEALAFVSREVGLVIKSWSRSPHSTRKNFK